MLMIWAYLLFSVLCFGLMIWVLFKTMSHNLPPPDEGDDEGGLPRNNFPIIDIPPGSRLEDILVDRAVGDMITSRKIVR